MIKPFILIFAVLSSLVVAAADAPWRETDPEKLKSYFQELNEFKAEPVDKLYLRTAAALPELRSKLPIKTVRFFDSDAREVGQFGQSGLYLAYFEVESPVFGRMREFVPFFYRRDGYLPDAATLDAWQKRKYPAWSWGEWIDAKSPKKAYFTEKDPSKFAALVENDPAGAMIFANILGCERPTGKNHFPASPCVQYYEQAAKTRFAIDKIERKAWKPLSPKSPPAPVLRLGSEEEAGFKPGSREKIREAAKRWCERSGQSRSFIIARNNVIFFMESFGNDRDGKPIDENTPMWAASISKSMGGMLFGTLIDQGLAKPYDPLSKLLPEFAKLPDGTASDLLIQDCYSHTTGLPDQYGHFGRQDNLFGDNAFWNIAPTLKSNSPVLYCGSGPNLAGHAMMRATGTPVTVLFEERLAGPLDLTLSSSDLHLAAGFSFSAMDYAKMAQMMLNLGSYGDKQILSEAACRELFPRLPRQQKPSVREEWGTGLSYRDFRIADADGKESGEYIFPPGFFVGHGAASDALFLFAPSEKLLIASGCNAITNLKESRIGRSELMKVISENMIRQQPDKP